MPVVDPKRGEIWTINFDPTVGQEIRKIRPALVMSVRKAGRSSLRMVVPITTGKPQFQRLFWMVEIRANSTNGLNHDSFANTFQFKSISVDRFERRLGKITSKPLLYEVASAIVLCIGYRLP